MSRAQPTATTTAPCQAYANVPPHQPFTPQQFAHRPHARVRFCLYDTELLVPLHWLHRPQIARQCTDPTEVHRCFYIGDLQAPPNFRVRVNRHNFAPQYGFQYEVNVLEVVEGARRCG